MQLPGNVQKILSIEDLGKLMAMLEGAGVRVKVEGFIIEPIGLEPGVRVIVNSISGFKGEAQEVRISSTCTTGDIMKAVRDGVKALWESTRNTEAKEAWEV